MVWLCIETGVAVFSAVTSFHAARKDTSGEVPTVHFSRTGLAEEVLYWEHVKNIVPGLYLASEKQLISGCQKKFFLML